MLRAVTCGDSMDGGAGFPDDAFGGAQDDLRRKIVAVVQERATALVADTVAVFPFSGSELLAPEYCDRIGGVIVDLLAVAIEEGKLDPHGNIAADLYRVARERHVSPNRLFTFVYLLERSVIDELALSEAIGVTTEPWPLVAQIVRRASFDMLAAYTERILLEPTEAGIVDRLTTLHTRALLDAVLAKEVERAGRLGYGVALILFDVDHLSDINQRHGYGVGDKILERLGIIIRQYFRQHDWVARHSEDSIAVLLSRTDPNHAAALAERVRATVEDRLEFMDHRTDQPVRITVSAAVINVDVAVGDTIDPERLLADAEAAVERAKKEGRNRVVRVDGYSGQQNAAYPPYSSS